MTSLLGLNLWGRPAACGRLLIGQLLVLSISTVAHAQPGPTPLIGPGVTAAGCFIQTDFVAGGKHNFELVVQEATNAVHYWRANDTSDTPWRKGDVISTRAIAPGCIVQSDFMSGGHGNLEAVVPEAGGLLVHYWRDSGNPASAWNRTGVVTTGVTGGACFITSDYTTNGHRNFEVMVQKGNQLWHHWHLAGAPFDNWPGELVTSGVTAVGPGCLIQSDYQAGGHRNFEVVVQKGAELWHHWRWNGMPAGAWPGKRIIGGVTAPGCLMASDYTANNIRNFEVLVQKGGALWHHWRWDGMTDDLWPGGLVTNPVTGAGCFLQGDFRSGAHANFELIVPAQIQEPILDVYGVRKKQFPNFERICSNADLNGTYGFYSTGTVVPVGTPRLTVGRDTYDGSGHLSNLFTVNDNGAETQHATSGLYTVNRDCTGTIVTPLGPLVLIVDFVIVDSGKEIYFMVSSNPAALAVYGVRTKFSADQE